MDRFVRWCESRGSHCAGILSLPGRASWEHD